MLDKNGQPILSGSGQPIPIPYTLYEVEWRVFGGIEIRDEHEVGAPVLSADVAGAVAPYVLSTDDEEINWRTYEDRETGLEFQAVRLAPFRYLGLARRPASSAVWSQKFALANPAGSIFAMAEAKLFNNSSWDLWTQDWQVQLNRMRDWDDWTRKMRAGIDDAALTDGLVSAEEVERAHEYMAAFPPEMADAATTH